MWGESEAIRSISAGARASRRPGTFEWRKTKVQQSTKTDGCLQAQQIVMSLTDPVDNNRGAKAAGTETDAVSSQEPKLNRSA